MHTKLKTTHPLDTLLAVFGFGFLLIFILSTKASAATGCTLAFSMNANATSVVSGGTVSRIVTVKNVGTTICKNVSYSLYYSLNETFVSSTPNARAGNYYWALGNLGSGRLSTMILTTKHNQVIPGDIIDTEGCTTASNGSDACTVSTVAVGSLTTAPVTTTSIVVVQPVATTTTSTTTQVISTSTPVTSTPTAVASGKELGMWIWNFPSQMLSVTADTQLKQLQTHGFNTVYITIDDYLDVASMPIGTAKTAAKKTYFDNLSKFVTKANALGMEVDAEGGWKDWAMQANRWKGFALIDAVKEYNAAYPNTKLRGFQYDVEPYLLDEYETNKAKVLTEFVAFIDQSADRFVGTNIKFSMAIPHFYDAAQAWTPAVTYGGKTLHTFNHLLNILEKTPGSTILLMSYRDTFEGANGTRNIVEAELKDAIGYSTRIIVSQETGNVDPDFVTFYGSTKTDVFNNLGQIGTAFKSSTSYGGNAVHYLDSFLEMCN